MGNSFDSRAFSFIPVHVWNIITIQTDKQMKRLSTIMMCLFAMMAASLTAKAQEVTITLYPAWTWISYPKAEVLDINTALGNFVPMEGDIIKSQFSSSVYSRGMWIGGVTHFMPGWGYKYYSNRTEVVSFVFGETAPQLVVTTAEVTGITMASATCGGNVASSNGDYVDVTLRGICWSYSPNPTFNDNYVEEGNGLGDFTILMSDLLPSTTYYVRAFAVAGTETYYGEEFSFTTLDHDRVDLGLPSGTLWATCNIDANKPWGSGSYFSWGETESKGIYEWSTYQYCNGSDTSLTKYCNDANYGYNGFTDSLFVLQPDDDAATVIWGPDWRTPSHEDWQELLDNTTHTYTTSSNGTKGFLFRGSNGNSIFLPVTDFRPSSTYPGYYNNGYYWSSSLGAESPNNAEVFTFCHSLAFYQIDNWSRRYGLVIRPVRSSLQN